jgi:hypothetical protein
MTRNRNLLLGLLVWVAVVTAGATLVWTVISDAGAGVAGELPTPPATPASGQGPSSRPSQTPSDTASPSGTAPSGTAPSGTAPSGTGTPSPSPPASSSTSDPQPPDPGPVRRTWQGAAGVVVAECRGGAIGLVGAQPASGWSVEVDDTGPDDLRVEFENGDARVRVEASCVDGTPSFAVGS